jgi:hypothetical protein
LVKRKLDASERLAGKIDWPGLAQVCKLTRITHSPGSDRLEIAYAVTSAPRGMANAAQLLAWWRGHWGIENRSHYVRDVTLGEDACQVGCGHAPQNLAAVRNALISWLRMGGHTNIAAGLRAYGWNLQRLLASLGKFKK